MGMFDTIHFKTPLLCPNCGAEHRSTQTKEFDCVLAHLKMGSVLSGSAVHTGIVKERLWCSACHKAGQSGDSPLYLVIWHSVLAGVEQDLAKAEARLAAVDRLDLIGWLDDWQREAARWQGNYWQLYNDLHCWHDYLARKDEPEPTGENAERQRAFRRFFDPPEEILNAPDPLAALLAANEHKREEVEG